MPRLRSNLTAIALLAAACASGQPFLSIGRNAELMLTGIASVRYDDNIFLGDSLKDDDVVYSVAPGIEYGYDGGLTQMSAVLSHEFLRYIDNADLNANLVSATFELVREGADSRLSVTAGYHEHGQNAINARSRNQAVRHNQTDGAVTGEIGVGGRTRLAGGASFSRASYPNTAFVGSEVVQLPVDVYYAFSPKLDLSVGYRYRMNKVNDGLRDSKDHFFNIGARGGFTPKLNGQVRVGWTERRFDTGGSDSRLGVGADLVWFSSPKTTFRLTVSNDFSNAAIGVSQTEFTVSINGRFEISDVWSTQSTLSCSSADYETGRTDDFFVGDFSIVYRLQEGISVQGAYTFRQNNSNVSSLDFVNNAWSLATSVRY